MVVGPVGSMRGVGRCISETKFSSNKMVNLTYFITHDL